MTAGIRVGPQAITVRVRAAAPHLTRLVARVTDTATVEPTHVLDILPGVAPQLRVDGPRRYAELHLPRDAGAHLGEQRVEIGVLQAATRALAAMSDGLALLHGSVTTLDGGRSAVAVLDGGLGQGKTSLAVALARAGGHLLVDEFTFVVPYQDRLDVVPLPRLPWHIRPDMTALLASQHDGRSLLYRPDLPELCWTGTQAVPLATILIPDQQTPAGHVDPLDPTAARQLLHAAVTDHAAKLSDPRLDHVSIFASPTDVTLHGTDVLPHTAILDRLTAVPAFRVGIGRPGDLPATVDAVLAAMAVA